MSAETLAPCTDVKRRLWRALTIVVFIQLANNSRRSSQITPIELSLLIYIK